VSGVESLYPFLYSDDGAGSSALPDVLATAADSTRAKVAEIDRVRTELCAVGLSTSGGSRNVLRAFIEARRIGMLTVGLAGYSGGAMAEAAERGEIEHLFVMPSDSVHRIQEAQTTTYHVLWELTVFALGE